MRKPVWVLRNIPPSCAAQVQPAPSEITELKSAIDLLFMSCRASYIRLKSLYVTGGLQCDVARAHAIGPSYAGCRSMHGVVTSVGACQIGHGKQQHPVFIQLTPAHHVARDAYTERHPIAGMLEGCKGGNAGPNMDDPDFEPEARGRGYGGGAKDASLRHAGTGSVAGSSAPGHRPKGAVSWIPNKAYCCVSRSTCASVRSTLDSRFVSSLPYRRQSTYIRQFVIQSLRPVGLVLGAARKSRQLHYSGLHNQSEMDCNR